jgi:hypothetical protein
VYVAEPLAEMDAEQVERGAGCVEQPVGEGVAPFCSRSVRGGAVVMPRGYGARGAAPQPSREPRSSSPTTTA